mmetsp:Transcript_44960/g.45383  ORF Transcript_44960/g.45383 Transcript_44960/m.45383 type:complete len:108 (+) Transcript_44960:1494-1817(+)
MELVPGSNLPGRSSLQIPIGPPPPRNAMAKYFADALMYCCSPVTVESWNPVKQNWIDHGVYECRDKNKKHWDEQDHRLPVNSIKIVHVKPIPRQVAMIAYANKYVKE